MLDHLGVGHLHPKLYGPSKRGRWLEMVALVDDDVLDAIGASGTPAEVGAKLAARNRAFADRSMLVLYDETGEPEALADLVRAFRDAERGTAGA